MGATDIERQAPNVFKMKLLGADIKPVISEKNCFSAAKQPLIINNNSINIGLFIIKILKIKS